MANITRNLDEEFIEYCRRNDLKRAEACLSLGVDVNTVSEDDYDGLWSGLSIAAHKNYTDLLEILLSHPQIKINNTTTYELHFGEILSERKGTALMSACSAGNSAIVSRLVQVPGLDINYQNEVGETALHRASRTKYCRNPWNPRGPRDHVDKNDLIAEHRAKMRGHTECVRILAESDRVDWNKRNSAGETPLYLALSQGHSDMVEIIVKQPNLDYNIKTNDGQTLAQAAVNVSRGYANIVENLAAQEKFQNWNIPDSDGNTPVLKALKNFEEMDILEILLKCPRVDLNTKDKNGDSLIMVALKTGKIDVVKQLLQHPRVDLSTRDGQGASLEMIAR